MSDTGRLTEDKLINAKQIVDRLTEGSIYSIIVQGWKERQQIIDVGKQYNLTPMFPGEEDLFWSIVPYNLIHMNKNVKPGVMWVTYSKAEHDRVMKTLDGFNREAMTTPSAGRFWQLTNVVREFPVETRPFTTEEKKEYDRVFKKWADKVQKRLDDHLLGHFKGEDSDDE